MQSVVQEAAAVAASRNQGKTPATWKTRLSPPNKRKEKKEKKEKKKDKKKRKGDNGMSKPGEVVMDDAGMIRVAHQPTASQSAPPLPGALAAAPPPPPPPPPLTAASLRVAQSTGAEIVGLSVREHRQPPEKIELRMTASAPEWSHERAESMSSKAGSTADSGFSQSSTPATFVSDDFSLYDTADSVRTDSPASSTNSEPIHQPLRHRESSDGFYMALSAGGDAEDLYARVDSVSKQIRGPGGGSVRSETGPPLPVRGYLNNASSAMTDLTQYARAADKEQDDELYATADN